MDKCIDELKNEIVAKPNKVFFVIPFELAGSLKIKDAVLSNSKNKQIKVKEITSDRLVFEIPKDSKWEILVVTEKKGDTTTFMEIDRLALTK